MAYKPTIPDKRKPKPKPKSPPKTVYVNGDKLPSRLDRTVRGMKLAERKQK